jgi:hypothetical protein
LSAHQRSVSADRASGASTASGSAAASSCRASRRAHSEPRSVARDALEKGNSGVSMRFSTPRSCSLASSKPAATASAPMFYDASGMADRIRSRTTPNSGSAMLSTTERFRSPSALSASSLGPATSLGMALEQQRSPRNSGVGMHMTSKRAFSDPATTDAGLLLLRPLRTVKRPALWVEETKSLSKDDEQRRLSRHSFKELVVKEALVHFTSTRTLRAVEDALQQLTFDRISRGLIVGFLRKFFVVGEVDQRSGIGAGGGDVAQRSVRGGLPAPSTSGAPNALRRTSPGRESPGRSPSSCLSSPAVKLFDKRTGEVLNLPSGGGERPRSAAFPRAQQPPFALPRPGTVPKCVTSFVDYVFEEALQYTVAPRVLSLSSSAASLIRGDDGSRLNGSDFVGSLLPSLQVLAGSYMTKQYGLTAQQVPHVWPLVERAIDQLVSDQS